DTAWLKLTAGQDPNNPAVATGLVIDMSHLHGDATFTRIDIGMDASDLNAASPVRSFGQAADNVEIDNLSQNAWSATAGTFTLPNLDLSVSTGAKSADPCGA